MDSAIQDLINMRDIESISEVMTENDDWMLCLDAAEALIMLGDERGIDFLQEATESHDDDIRTVAQEILDSDLVRQFRLQLRESLTKDREELVQKARQRLAEGKKVFRFKTVYLSAADFLKINADQELQTFPILDDLGLAGWQVAAFFPPREVNAHEMPGARLLGGYFLLQKEFTPDEAAELDKI